MVNILAPVVATGPTCVKAANFPGLYRHARSGRYYACQKLGGIRRERSLQTSDRKIAERRVKEWTRIRLVQGRQEECFAAEGAAFPALPGRELQLIDVRNLFCASDKSALVTYPQCTPSDGCCRVKQRFQPSAAILPRWHPPKWGVNDRLDMMPNCKPSASC